MVNHEPIPPARDETIIKAATELAAIRISKLIVNAMCDRGGNIGDVFELLATVNAVLITSVAEQQDEPKKACEMMAADLHADTLTEMTRQRADLVIRDLFRPPMPKL